MKFFEKKNKIIQSYNTKYVDGAEIWIVSWNSRVGEFSQDIRPSAKSFLSYEDAKTFYNSLKEAKALLQDKDNIHIKIEKQV